MTPEKQRIAIAEVCGAKWRTNGSGFHWITFDTILPHPSQRPSNSSKIKISLSVPRYLDDLNAMHEAEKALSDDQQLHYITFLMGRKSTDGMWDLSWDAAYHCAHAHAAQRAEAFLRTIGKWEEPDQTEHPGASDRLAGGDES